MAAVMAEEKPAPLHRAKARRFLRKLASSPFVAIVMEDDTTSIYAKGVSEEDLRTIKEMLGIDEEE